MTQQRREGQEGNRWVNRPPTSEELTKWFEGNVEIEEGLDAGDYVGGIALIPNVEKSREVIGWNQSGAPNIQDVENLVFTPYMKVETKVKYFHDLMEEESWIGFIDPVAPAKQDPRLPEGFFMMATRTEGGEVRFICRSMKVTIYEKDGFKEERVLVDSRQGLYETVRTGTVVKSTPPGTKAVPVLNRWGKADADALMKAETGAVGRALGMAGILIIPGTGLATAEDLQESRANDGTGGAAPEDASLPPEALPGGAEAPPDDEAIRKEVSAAIERIKKYPAVFKEFSAWMVERNFTRLSEVTSPALRGILRRAETMAAEAEASGPPEPKPEPEPEKPPLAVESRSD